MSEEAAVESAPESGEVSGDIGEAAPEAGQEVGSEQSSFESAPEAGQEVGGEEAAIDDIIDEALDDGASEEEIKDMIRSYKIKVNGEERDVELDFNNKDDIVRRLQMAEAGQRAMQDKAELERDYEAGFEKWKKDPNALFDALGIDADEYAERRIQDQIDDLSLTDEERLVNERERELEDLREQLKEQETARRDAETARLYEEAQYQLDEEISNAMSATSKLPSNALMVKRVTDAMLYAMDNGYPDVTAEEIIPSVEAELREEWLQMADAMNDDQLDNWIGGKVNDRMRTRRLKRAKTPVKQVIQDTGLKGSLEPKSIPKISMRDFLKR